MSRARRIGRALAGGGKSTAVGGGAGVATYYAHKFLSTKVAMVQKHPIISPLVMVAGGHLLKKRMPTVANGIIGAAGYALGLAIDVARANKAATTETAAMISASNVAALLEANQVQAYEIPDAGEDEAFVDYSSAMALGT
jgi:hypothetical protein